jgi:hypothetical protein
MQRNQRQRLQGPTRRDRPLQSQILRLGDGLGDCFFPAALGF